MSFGSPYLLLTLLVVPAAIGVYVLAQRRRIRYAVSYTNVDVLALVATGRPWRRWLAGAIFLLSIAALCLALARPHVVSTVTKENATVVLVLDVSGSMQAEDVKPTRLSAAQRALHIFLNKVPSRLKVGLILFAGEPVVATPPTTDHALVSQAIDDAGLFRGFGGTAIGDALAAAVQVGLRSAGLQGQTQASALEGTRSPAAFHTAAGPRHRPASSLVSILFLSDGAQTRGELQPLQGAARAKAAGIPVYTVALGTTGNTVLRGFPGGSLGGGFAIGGRGLAPDPRTLRAIAVTTGGKFYRAKTAGAAADAYRHLGSSLGRTHGRAEVTDWFVGGGAILLVLAGVLGSLWAPRLP